MALQIKKISGSSASIGELNLNTVRGLTLAQIINHPNLGQIKRLLCASMLTIAQQAQLPPLNTRFNIRKQSGLTCQTALFGNAFGMLYQEDGPSELIFQNIDTIRDKARNDGYNPMETRAIGYVLQSQNILNSIDTKTVKTGSGASFSIKNPIQETENLFRERSFMAVTVQNEFGGLGHAYALIPSTSPSEEKFVIKLDSLAGEQSPLSFSGFLDMLLSSANPQSEITYQTYEATVNLIMV